MSNKLYFRYSAMNSGKTTQLIQVAHNYEERGMKPLVVKPGIDTKGGPCIISRIGVARKVDVLLPPNVKLSKILSDFESNYWAVDVILIDEVQFLSREQVDDLLNLSLHYPIICYGLRTDFKREGFEGSTRLLQVAHNIEELKNICQCGKKATFSILKYQGKYTDQGNQIQIDNQPESVEYEAVCNECYNKLIFSK
ncbi:thymidine kinase [Clostridium phage CP3]|nr:thymidine kinase [Clostridium phage CP3]